MKRLILTSLIAVGAVMAQTGATGTAPAAPKSQTPVVKKHKRAKKPAATTPAAAQAPASKQGK